MSDKHQATAAALSFDWHEILFAFFEYNYVPTKLFAWLIDWYSANTKFLGDMQQYLFPYFSIIWRHFGPFGNVGVQIFAHIQKPVVDTLIYSGRTNCWFVWTDNTQSILQTVVSQLGHKEHLTSNQWNISVAEKSWVFFLFCLFSWHHLRNYFLTITLLGPFPPVLVLVALLISGQSV